MNIAAVRSDIISMIGLAPGILVGLALTVIGARLIYRTGWWAEIEKKRRVK